MTIGKPASTVPASCRQLAKQVLIAVFLFLMTFGKACAQDDGARLYMVIPDKTTIVSMRVHYLHSNLAVDPGAIAGGDHLDTTLVVFQFVQTLKIAGGQSSIFFVLPVSHIKPDYAQPAGAPHSVLGLGDAQLGFVLGVHGTPALAPAEYAEHKPGLAVNLLAKVFFPTGDYESNRAINVGANRWALRLGVPLVYAIGDRMADPHLTTIELMPTVTFFGRNADPMGANSTQQKPLFILEGHLTRGISPKFWASLDLLWRQGGEVDIDGVGANNFQSAVSLGATGTLALSRNSSLRVSYGGVVDRNSHGPNGWMLRTILGFTF
jgi:hypothetical protein